MIPCHAAVSGSSPTFPGHSAAVVNGDQLLELKPRGNPTVGALIVFGIWDVGQPILAAAAFRGGFALNHRNGSCRCKAETPKALKHPPTVRVLQYQVDNTLFASSLGTLATFIYAPNHGKL
jgi:hypothetical protein